MGACPHRRFAGRPVNAGSTHSATLSVEAMRSALADGARVAFDLALIASQDASRANLDALVAQLSGLQSMATRIRAALDASSQA